MKESDIDAASSHSSKTGLKGPFFAGFSICPVERCWRIDAKRRLLEGSTSGLALVICLLLLGLISFNNSVIAQENRIWTSPDGMLRLSIPDAYETVPPASSGPAESAVLLLKDRQGGFPTFNVIIQPAAAVLSDMAPEAYGKEILSSYRLVGITDVRLLNAQRKTVSGRTALEALLAYRHGGADFVSAVLVITMNDIQYTLTYIERDSEEARSRLQDNLFERVFKVKLSPSAEGRDAATSTAAGGNGASGFLLTALVAAAALLVCFFLMRRLHRYK